MLQVSEEARAKFKLLLSPLKVGPLELRNRMVMAPMETNYASRDGYVTDHMIDYYAERGKAGVGMIIIEASTAQPGGELIKNECAVHHDRYINGLRELAGSIKRTGTPVLIQLVHAGARSISDVNTQYECVAPSDVPLRSQQAPRPMTTQEVRQTVTAFAEAARRAEIAGFDGVEVHGAHFYLVSEFLSPFTNKRQDEYGGSLEGRAKFALDIVRAIRARVSRDFLVSFRINAVERVPGGLTMEDSLRAARMLEEAGVDILSVSAVNKIEQYKVDGKTFNIVYSLLPKDAPMGGMASYAAEMKKVVRIPVITVGKIWDPHVAEGILEEGKADLIAIGRTLISDSQLPRKVMENRAEDINICTQCPACSVTVMQKYLPLACGVNKDLKRKYAKPGRKIE